MNKMIKKVTVHFFNIDTEDHFFQSFVSNFEANKKSTHSARVMSVRSKKYLVKISKELSFEGVKAYAITVVRERNTWQTKATSDGKISGIQLNQGIIGDPYFFLVIPEKKTVLGFTTGPSGSLKGVAKYMLEQLCNDRLTKIKLDLIPKKKEFDALKRLPEDSILLFKIDPSYLSDLSESAPKFLKDLSSAPYIENSMQLSLQLDIGNQNDNGLTANTAIEIITYLSDHESCSLLRVKGSDVERGLVDLDFVNAFVNYKTDITTRTKYIDEKQSVSVLEDALSFYLKSD